MEVSKSQKVPTTGVGSAGSGGAARGGRDEQRRPDNAQGKGQSILQVSPEQNAGRRFAPLLPESGTS